MPICIHWNTELLPDPRVAWCSPMVWPTAWIRPREGLALQIRPCWWMPRITIPAGEAAAAGSRGSSSSPAVLGPCWRSLLSSSPGCSGFSGWNAWPHIAVSTGLLFHSVKSWDFCYLDIFLMSPKTLWALIYHLCSFSVSFGWSYNSHFATEKLSTRLLQVLSVLVVYCVFWGTEALGHRPQN